MNLLEQNNTLEYTLQNDIEYTKDIKNISQKKQTYNIFIGLEKFTFGKLEYSKILFFNKPISVNNIDKVYWSELYSIKLIFKKDFYNNKHFIQCNAGFRPLRFLEVTRTYNGNYVNTYGLKYSQHYIDNYISVNYEYKLLDYEYFTMYTHVGLFFYHTLIKKQNKELYEDDSYSIIGYFNPMNSDIAINCNTGITVKYYDIYVCYNLIDLRTISDIFRIGSLAKFGDPIDIDNYNQKLYYQVSPIQFSIFIKLSSIISTLSHNNGNILRSINDW